MKLLKFSILLLSLGVLSCTSSNKTETKITSPDDSLAVEFILTDKGEPTYQVTYKNEK